MKKVFRHFVKLLIIVCTSGVALGQTSERINIAVIDLDAGGGLSQFEAVTLTNRLRSMLVNTDAFTVLERGKMEEVLQELGFQQTGCTSTECAVEIGKILNVQQMVTGTIGKLGKLYTLDIVLIDVATSRIMKSLTRDYRGEIEGLIELMRSIANELAGIGKPTIAEPAVVAPTVGAFGIVEIMSSPSEATVYIDGIKLGLTPFRLDELRAGEHTIKLVKDRHIDFEDTFSLTEGESKKIEASLERLNVLNLASTPSGATLYLDEELKGVTPVRLVLKTGTYKFKIKKEGYADWEKELSVNQDLAPNFTLLRMVNVWFLTEPPQVEIYLDNLYVGETPVEKAIVEGPHLIRFRKERYKDFQRQVVVKEGTQVQERLELLEEFKPIAIAEKKEKVVKKKRGNKLLWLSLGAVAAGGAAYYFLLQPPEEEPTGFPEPPGRP